MAAALFSLCAACQSPDERIRCYRERDALAVRIDELDRRLQDRDARVVELSKQVDALTLFGADRPADAFAPVAIEIARLSGGADYDGRPGDDGVTIYLRLRDADGDSVKTPGQVRIQLLDPDDLQSPRVIGVYDFTRLDDVRSAWYGRFGTHHFAFKCPFPAHVKLPDHGTIQATVEFVDYLSGRALSATERLRFKSAPGGP
jgi:hypothetical protein